MEAKKLCQMTDRVLTDCSSAEECPLLEEWYRSCESNTGLLQQFSRVEQDTMRKRQLLTIRAKLSFQKMKVFLVVV